MKLIANIDGGSRGNPGPAAAGVVLRTADDGTIIHQAGIFLGKATNNVAEYQGLLEAFRRAERFKAGELEIISDSELLVKQMNGEYRVKNEGLRPLFDEANRLWNRFKHVKIRHVRREQNKDADAMANKAMNVKHNVEE